MTGSGLSLKRCLRFFVFAVLFFSACKVFAAAWENERDPLVVAKAVADKELFHRVMADDEVVPELKVRHNYYWRDGTLMSGVAELYDRTEELGSPVQRYLTYLEAWGRHDPGGYPFPIFHGDAVCAGQTYIWLYERSGKTSKHLEYTDGMINFIFKGRKFMQWGTGYNDYWMRFWNDDIHMVPPFLAMRGRATGNSGIPDGKDARAIAMDYCRAYEDILRDPQTGLFWHDRRTIGDYQWSRGNGWVAAGYTKVMKALENDPAYADDVEWLKSKLLNMSETLRDNRNTVGTWNADVLNRETFNAPETSGSVFFVYMMASMINRGYLEQDYVPVVQKAWHFLKLSVKENGDLMRVQPVGGGPIKEDFEDLSQAYGVGGFLLAAAEMSRLPGYVLDDADSVECVNMKAEDLEKYGDMAVITLAELREKEMDIREAAELEFQAVLPGRRLPPTFVREAADSKVVITNFPEDYHGAVYLFYKKLR